MRILVVENDRTVRDFIERALTESGFTVDAAGLAGESEKLALAGVHDAVIVDPALPDGEGLDLIERLRGQGVTAPVLILSARRSVEETVSGLDKGADDYMTMPFAISELVARVRALLRRGAPVRAKPTRLWVGTLELDLIRRETRRDGVEIQLTRQEFLLLEYLVRNTGQVVTREKLLSDVLKISTDAASNIVDVHISRLRRKMDNDPQRPLIRTMRGFGYVLTTMSVPKRGSGGQ